MKKNTTKEDYKKESISMFKVACDPSSLTFVPIETLALQASVKAFVNSKASKTDFTVLIGLIDNFWHKESSSINISSYSDFRLATGSKLANANISRALRSLVECEFLIKIEDSSNMEYIFSTAFDVLKSEAK